jgi:2,4-dienoyl-CoA reductase-like NADH-dependent reductase (Old Yellow Enzyme family)
MAFTRYTAGHPKKTHDHLRNQMTEHLFSPLTLRGLTLRNRIGVSPMCQYSSVDGMATDWHLVHLGSRAVGGAALVMVEATAVEARGRISPADMGLWNDEQIEPLARIARFVGSQGAVPAIQIAHAGRKASTVAPWLANRALTPEEGAWEVVAPSPIPFAAGFSVPHELTKEEIGSITGAFVSAARRAREAGFQILEVHSAHGYLFHEFLSPLTNQRTDEYGGTFPNRTRFLSETVKAVRAAWPDDLPLFVRFSATDWKEDGWDIEQSVALARCLRDLGVDMIDVSSGGIMPGIRIPVGPGYQTPFAARIRREAGIPTAAVGEITAPTQADHIIRTGQADLVLLAREFLRHPYWPLHAAQALGHPAPIPQQYGRAFPQPPRPA